MDIYERNRMAIAVLESKIGEMDRLKLSDDQMVLLAEMKQEVRRLKMLQTGLPLSRPGINLGGSGNQGPFRSLGEQLQCIASSSRPGAQVDSRLWEIRAATGLSESIPSEGGFLVQQDFSNEILANVFDSGKIAARCRRIQVSSGSNQVKIPGLDETSRVAGSRWGGVLSYWLAEAAEKTASKPTFRQIELTLKKQVVLCYVTDELLQDASVLENVIRRVATDELRFSLEDAIINGTGAGQPLGILNSGSLISVSKEAGQAAATVVYENIAKMWSRLLGASRPNAVWLINQNIEPQLYTMSLSVGTGGAPVFLPGGGVSASPYMTLFGRPIIVCEQCPTLGTIGDIILADLTGGYILAEKGGITTDVSIHVRFLYDESVFRFVMRVDGQPVLSSAITPYKGGAGNSQSHFVALATRS
jgi:HK97 family phage major capsid protein